MVAEPSIYDIDEFVNISGITRSDAIGWLKAYNDLNGAIDAFFENPNALQSQQSNWNDNHFNAGKEYKQHGPQNQIEASFDFPSDDTLHPGTFAAALSRPPSRASIRGANDNAVGQSKPLSADEQEQEDIQKALAMSMSQTLPDQEVGVTDASGVHFGPATRNHYDDKIWGLTFKGSRAQEIVQNPCPELRKRAVNTPAFMKPSPAGHHLPGLVTILHAIPMAREALLTRDYTLADYGHGSEWWDGLAIQVPKIVDLDQLDEDTEWREIIFESQRLMAFLDETERSYGSVDVLANLVEIGNYSEMEESFFETWQEMVGRAFPEYVLKNVFRNRAFIDGAYKTFDLLDLQNYNNGTIKGYTLYDAFDDALWRGYTAADPEELYMDNVADVLVIRVSGNIEGETGHGIKIPSIWYPDRYLKESTAAARQMRSDKETVTEHIQKIGESQAKIKNFQESSNLIDATKLLDVTRSYLLNSSWEAKPSDHIEKMNGTSSIDTRVNKITYSQVAQELQVVAERVAQKFNALERSKELALEKMRELSKLYTKCSDEPNVPPHNKYTLRGVCTEHHTTYVLERTRPNDADDVLSAEPIDWQWWKICFSVNDTNPVSCTKVREIEVLKAAKEQSQKTLLVYASEKAVSYEIQTLPPQILNFVRADNLDFAAELDTSSSPKSRTSPKRKADDTPQEDDDSPNWGGNQSSSPKKANAPTASTSMLDRSQPPPPYTPSKPPAALPRSSLSRGPAYKSQNITSYDDYIPKSLQVPEPPIDPNSIALDDVYMNNEGTGGAREMEERKGGTEQVRSVNTRTGTSEIGEYTLGSFVPDITMEDMDEEGGKGE